MPRMFDYRWNIASKMKWSKKKKLYRAILPMNPNPNKYLLHPHPILLFLSPYPNEYCTFPLLYRSVSCDMGLEARTQWVLRGRVTAWLSPFFLPTMRGYLLTDCHSLSLPAPSTNLSHCTSCLLPPTTSSSTALFSTLPLLTIPGLST